MSANVMSRKETRQEINNSIRLLVERAIKDSLESGKYGSHEVFAHNAEYEARVIVEGRHKLGHIYVGDDSKPLIKIIVNRKMSGTRIKTYVNIQYNVETDKYYNSRGMEIVESLAKKFILGYQLVK